MYAYNDNEGRDTLQNIGNSLYTDTSNQPRRLHCIMVSYLSYIAFLTGQVY